MKRYLKILLLLLTPVLAKGQKTVPDSLKHALSIATTDSARFVALDNLAWYNLDGNRNSALYYADHALLIARKGNRHFDEAICLDIKGYELTNLGKYPEALECFQLGIKIFDDPGTSNDSWLKNTPFQLTRSIETTSIHADFGDLLGVVGNKKEQLSEYNKVVEDADPKLDPDLSYAFMSIGREYTYMGKLDSALIFEQKAAKAIEMTHRDIFLPQIYLCTGNIYFKRQDEANTLLYYRKSIAAAKKQNNLSVWGDVDIALTNYYRSKGQKDSSLYYAKKALQILRTSGAINFAEAYYNLSKSYKLEKNIDSAYKYQGLAIKDKDSNYSSTLNNLTGFQKLSFNEQLKLQELEKEKDDAQARNRTYMLMVGIGFLLFIAVILFRNSLQRKKANTVLQKTLVDLKTTQIQLIQKEKMASLGELTAGIAHEIQNPLNFVNNFSEVNKEMLEDLKAESAKPKAERDEQLAMELIDDLIGNEEKINHHGKRADSIVKGMLEHSKIGSGEKTPTDINALADEFLKLSYHGLRAKDKNFNAELITHFDEKLPKVNIAAQDIGRVLLNLFNNAFYAVNQKRKTTNTDYKPEVTVTTASENGNTIIRVKDNGIGIPDSIKDKIMQPFFTTKPTGVGTGLGLSLSYDIVVKGHGGSITVESKEGETTAFIITLPIS